MNLSTDGMAPGAPGAGRVLGMLARQPDGRLRPVEHRTPDPEELVTILRSDAGDVVVFGGFDADDPHDREAVVAVHRGTAP